MKFIKFVDVSYEQDGETINTVQGMFGEDNEDALMQSQNLVARDWLTDKAIAMHEAGDVEELATALQEACQSMKIVIGKDGYGKLVAQ